MISVNNLITEVCIDHLIRLNPKHIANAFLQHSLYRVGQQTSFLLNAMKPTVRITKCLFIFYSVGTLLKLCT